MLGIVPKNKAPGVDFCGVKNDYYIVRSDMNCYLRSSNFNEGRDMYVYSLHQSCRGGEHYLAFEDGGFYIIKGTNFRRVTNLNEDTDAVVYSIHPNCQGGDHYLAAFGCFYIIFQSRGIYRRVGSLNTDENAAEYALHPECRNGLYYWGSASYYYFVKPHDEWGVQYYKCTNFGETANARSYSFHADIINFLPGGLSLTLGPSYGVWECIKTISNDSETPISWAKKITKKVGYTKEKMSSVEHNWNVAVSASFSSGDLTAAFAKYQFSVTAEYGGSSVNTETESWSEATEVEESVNLTLAPGKKMHVWQFKLGLGKQDVLFCRDVKFNEDPTPPTEIPLKPSNSNV